MRQIEDVTEYYVVNPTTGCWQSTRASGSKGYVTIGRNGKSIKLHVFMFKWHGGIIPPGYILDHLCKNTSCCNPKHLEPVTNAVNVQRGRSTKLSVEQVLEIRKSLANGIKPKVLAMHYKVSPSAIAFIKEGRQNRWVNV